MIKVERYKKYKDSGVEWIGKIPEHWDVIPTKRIFKLVTDFAPKNNSEELLSVYTSIGVKPRKELEERGNKATTTDGYWIVKKRDIIVNKLLAWMGAIGISEYDGVTSPAYDVLRQIRSINPYYYNYIFRTPYTHQEFKRHSRGIMEVRLRLYFSDLGRIYLPVPPLDDQNRIVDFLNKKTQQASNLIEKQERLIDLLKEEKKAIISKAVTKGINPDVEMKDSGIEWLREIPEHWKVLKLKLVTDFVYRGTTPSYVLNSECKVVNQATYSKGYWDESSIRFHNLKCSEDNRGMLEMKDILLASTGGGVLGKVGLFTQQSGKYIADSHVTIIRDRKNMFVPEFLFYFFHINYALIDGYFAQGSTNQTELQREWLRQMILALPPIEEQKKIVQYIEQQTTKINKAIEQAQREITLIKDYIESLVYNAVTGQIKV